MNSLKLVLIAVLFVPLSVFSQQRFHRQMPPGNYSGICHIGGDDYAVVNDKAPEDGFHVFHINIDTVKGHIVAVSDKGYRSAQRPNRDMEGIAYRPSSRTLFISGESDNKIEEYLLDATPTGRRLSIPDDVVRRASRNGGLEALTYSTLHHRFYTTTEHPLDGDTLHRILTFNDQMAFVGDLYYRADAPISRKYKSGISALCSLDDGRLLVLERQIRVPRLKIGARTVVRIYEAIVSDTPIMEKRLVAELTGRLNLTSRRFANYEGLCQTADGKWVLLIADSQNRYKHVLRDWLYLLKL